MKRVGAAGYDFALRERIVAAVEGGRSVKETARQFSVTLMTVYTYVKRHRLGVLDVVGKPTGRPFRVTTEHEAQLLKQLETHSDATLVEHARLLGRTDAVHDACPHARSRDGSQSQFQNS